MKRTILWMLLAAFWLALASCTKPDDRRPTPDTRKELQTITEEPTVKQTVQYTEAAPAFACDAVFFGDSITADSNFDELFPELNIVNLGVYGDTIEDLIRRVPSVQAAKPARIFLLGGINCLNPDNVELCLDQYRELLDNLRAACPAARIIVQSVLPVGADLDPGGKENAAVRQFNEGLQELAAAYGLRYADIHSAYEKDGALDPSLTRDGLHLNFNAYGPWAALVEPYLNGG